MQSTVGTAERASRAGVARRSRHLSRALLIFTGLVALALLLRRRPEAHKRLMTLATIQTLMAAPLAHLVGHFRLPGIILPAWGVAVAVTVMAYDWRSRKRIHPASNRQPAD